MYVLVFASLILHFYGSHHWTPNQGPNPRGPENRHIATMPSFWAPPQGLARYVVTIHRVIFDNVTSRTYTVLFAQICREGNFPIHGSWCFITNHICIFLIWFSPLPVSWNTMWVWLIVPRNSQSHLFVNYIGLRNYILSAERFINKKTNIFLLSIIKVMMPDIEKYLQPYMLATFLWANTYLWEGTRLRFL